MSETILPDNAVVFVSHGQGQPIYINFGPGDHSVIRKQISKRKALDMAIDLIRAASSDD